MSKLPDGIVIRKGVIDDCEEVLRLVKELAEYENMLPQVRLTLDQFREDGFGDDPYFQLLVVEKRGPSDSGTGEEKAKLIGHALYFKKYSTFEGRSIYLEDIYVAPAFRKQGIGFALFKNLAEVAVSENCVRIDFCVLSWNKMAIDFYERLGAADITKRENWHFFGILDDKIRKLASC